MLKIVRWAFKEIQTWWFTIKNQMAKHYFNIQGISGLTNLKSEFEN